MAVLDSEKELLLQMLRDFVDTEVRPLARTLEVFELDSGRWVLLRAYGDDDKVTAEPFAAAEIDLANLWLGYEPPPSREPD